MDGDAIGPPIIRRYDGGKHLVYPLGDVHLGAPAHQDAKWHEWREYVRRAPRASLVGTGDFLNAALKDSKSDAYEEKLTVGEAKRRLIKQLEPLAKQGKIDLLIPGNHEDRITRAIGDCPIRDVADMLEIPYAKSCAVILYEIGDQEYSFYVRHGTGNGQSLAGLKKSFAVIPGMDVYVTGHTHRQGLVPDEYFHVTPTREIVRRKTYFVSSGAFLGLESYAAERGYTPTRIGAPRIELNGERHDVHVSL